MATTTPNYGWPVPTSTDLVKDGAQAIEDLGDAIDATVFSLGDPGLVLVKSQVIGTTVASVAVTSAFNTNYDAYKIIVSGGTSSVAQENINLQLGSTATGYYWAWNYVIYTGSGAVGAGNNAANWRVGRTNVNYLSVNIDIVNPFLSNRKYFYAVGASGNESGMLSGMCDFTTSITGFTLSVGTGTMTGGTIYVYGYVK